MKVAEAIKRYWAVPAAVGATLSSSVAIMNNWERLGLPVFITKEFHEEYIEDVEERLTAEIQNTRQLIVSLHERRERLEELNAIVGSLEKGLNGLEEGTEAWESINEQLQAAKNERSELEAQVIFRG